MHQLPRFWEDPSVPLSILVSLVKTANKVAPGAGGAARSLSPEEYLQSELTAYEAALKRALATINSAGARKTFVDTVVGVHSRLFEDCAFNDVL